MEQTLEKRNTDEQSYCHTQPKEYSYKELIRLKEFIETLKNEDKRTQLVCWGNHGNYTHGY